MEITTQTLGWYLPPSRALHGIALLGLVVRVVASFLIDSIHHPDEIYQYLEQGHRLAFGYGFIPWEFIYGVRSWLIPGTISGLLSVASEIGFDQPALYIPMIKIFFCLLSLSLVYGSFVVASLLADQRAGLTAAFVTSFWYEFIFFASKPTPEVLGTYTLIGMLACAVRPPANSVAYGFGALAALTVALRLQYAPAVAIAWFYVLLRWRPHRIHIIKGILAALLIGIAYGFLDHLTWGLPFSSVYNNLLYNQVYEVSKLFGLEPFWYYGMTLGVASGGLLLLLPVAGLWRIRRTWFPLSCALSILLLHVFIPHKEHRFLFAAVALLWVVGAIVISHWENSYDVPAGRKTLGYAAATGFLIITVLGLFSYLPGQSRVYNHFYDKEHASIKHLWDSLRDEEILRAVLLLDPPWYETEGYYRLHKPVPIYTPHHMPKILETNHEIHPFVTHVVCRTFRGNIPGFQRYRQSGKYEIRRRTTIESAVEKPKIRSFLLPQPGVTDRFQPRVKKRL